MVNYHIKPIASKTGSQTPGSPNLENGNGILYFTFFTFSEKHQHITILLKTSEDL